MWEILLIVIMQAPSRPWMGEHLPSTFPELEVVTPLLTDVGTVLTNTDDGTVFVPTDVAETAWAEETAATRPSPLVAVLQQVFVVPLTEQQKSPLLTAEPWHSTTQFASPGTNISLVKGTSRAKCLPVVQNLGQIVA